MKFHIAIAPFHVHVGHTQGFPRGTCPFVRLMRQALPPYSSRLLFLGSCTLVVSIPLVLLALRLPSTSTFLQRTVDRVSGRIKEKKQRPRALPPASLHVHVALKGVTVRESDIGLLRSLLHPSITLTHGDEVDPLTQVLVANFPSKGKER